MYESIVAPSLRLSIRYKLFELRDTLRLYKINNSELDNKIFDFHDNAINKTISNCTYYTVGLFYQYKRYLDENPDVKVEIEKIRKWIDANSDNEIKRIQRENIKLSALALLVNHGIWTLYLLPIVLLLIIALVVFSSLKSLLIKPIAEMIKNFSSTPANRFPESIITHTHAAEIC